MKRIAVVFVCLFAFVVGAQAALASTSNQAVTIRKSDSDQSEYRYITLSNQMKVLLVSDAKADKAAASLDVFAGSANDPVGRQGLAHFLEHMLFLGTDLYPDPDEYQAFISEHGGRHNAYTSFEHTNYFFDINPSQFEAALDRFSRFFVAPLFNAEYVEREKNAVHSEYKARIKNDYRRQWEVVGQVVNQKHPAAKFSVGSLETLADTEDSNVRDDLLAFYKQHYSANRMALVVVAPNTLDELEGMVRERFQEIPSFNSLQPRHGQPLFEPGSLPKLVALKPVQELRELTVTFPLPAVRDYYRQKPLAYVSNLIGHEGEGSLLSLLKKEGLAEGLRAGKGVSDFSGSSFDITVSLTPEGVSRWPHVLEWVFSEIALVADQGVAQWRQKEQAALADMQFRHKEVGSPVHRVSQLASQLHLYPPEEVMHGPYLMDRYNAELIVGLLERMTPENAFVTLMAPEVETDRVSPRYHVPYRVSSLPKIASDTNVAELKLPPANDFVPESFSLKFPDKSAEPGKPSLVVDRTGLRLWHYPDSYYQVPKAQFYVAVKTPAITNASDAAMADLYLSLVDELLNESSYSAALAGLGYHVSRRADGIGFIVSGFDNKLSVLVEDVVAGLLAPLTTEIKESKHTSALIERLRHELIRSWRNDAKDTPYKQLLRESGTLLGTNAWQSEKLAAALENFDREAFDQFGARLYQGASLEILASGNMTSTEVEKLAAGVASQLVSESPVSWVERGVVRIPVGSKLQSHLSVDHKDVGVFRYYQGRDDSVAESARVMLLRQLIKSDFFHQLRTEQQLGYVVAVVDKTIDRVPGFGLLVQSPTVPVEQIEKAMDQFLVTFKQKLEQIPADEFERHRQAVLTGLREKPKSLSEQSARFWGSIDLRDYAFKGREKLIKAVEQIEREEMEESYKALMMDMGYSIQFDSNDGHALAGDKVALGRGIYVLSPGNL